MYSDTKIFKKIENKKYISKLSLNLNYLLIKELPLKKIELFWVLKIMITKKNIQNSCNYIFLYFKNSIGLNISFLL